MNIFSETFQLLKEKMNKVTVRIILGLIVMMASAFATVIIADRISDNETNTKVLTVAGLNSEGAYTQMLGELGASKINYKDLEMKKQEEEELSRLEKADKKVDTLAVASVQAARDMAAEEALDFVASRTVEKIEADNKAAARALEEERAAQRLRDANAANAASQANLYAEGYDPLTASQNNNAGNGGITYTLTGYCPCSKCCGKYSNPSNPTTASGTTATAGRTIAADTKIYPFGTQISINGNVYTVEDTGSGVNGYHFDIYFNTHDEALQFGRRYTTNVVRLN